MPESRPNIILIITDQQRFDTIRALGFDYVDTPNLDRLVHEGVSFDQCFITAPSCAPSRASLFTGYYPHTTGILKNADPWKHSWVEDLNTSGYRCINIGKMHTFPYDVPLGFHERYVVENKDRFLEERWYFDEWDKALRAQGYVKQQREFYRQRDDYRERLGAFEWELPAETQSDVFVGELARWWVDTKPKSDRPLFLQVGFPGPHPPYDPTPEAAAPYLHRELPLPEVTDAEIASQPPAFRAMIEHNLEVDHDSLVHQLHAPESALHRQRAYYLANVTMIDEQVGALLHSLEAKGHLDVAVVIFCSDHGDCLGDHGHSQKWTMYDIITRVPCIVWAPNRFPGGRRIDALCQLFDLGPTILELAGLGVPETFEAESLLAPLSGQDWAGREEVFAEHGRDGILAGTEFMSMVRTVDWKLVHFLDEPDGQLFDLRQDPEEKLNLWSDRAYDEPRRALLDRLREWRLRSGYRTRKLWTDAR